MSTIVAAVKESVTTRIRNFICESLGINKEWISDDSDFILDRNEEDRKFETERALKQYGDSVLRLCFSYLKNLDSAEDALQDTLIKYLQKAPEFQSRKHEEAWIMRVAINICKNKLTREKKKQFYQLDNNLVGEVYEDLAFVWEAVASLPIKYREVIHLFYQEDYSTTRIAELLGKKESTIRSLLHRGRKALKELLKEGYDFEE